MAKKMPKYIVKKIDRMNDLMQQIVELNADVEEWMEKNGIEDGFAFTYDYRDDRGYGIHWPEQFIEAVENEMQ